MPTSADTHRAAPAAPGRRAGPRQPRRIGARLALSVLVIALAGSGSAFAFEVAGARDGDAMSVRPTSADGLELLVGAGDGAASSGAAAGGPGSTIAALATTPMAPGEQRWGEFTVSSLGTGRTLVAATIVTTERHGGRPARGCFRYRLARAARQDSTGAAGAGAIPYGGEDVRLLDGGGIGGAWRGGTSQRYRLTISMGEGCAPRPARSVSGSLVIRLHGRAA